MLARAMTPFTVAIFAEVPTFRGNQETLHTLSNNTLVDIAMWKAFLPLAAMDPRRYARSLESFRPLPEPTVDFGGDGSLGGIGLGITDLRTGRLLAYAGVYPLPCLDTSDSSYQNTFELIWIVLSLFISASLGMRNFAYSATADSKVTLAWVRDDKVSSEMGRRASIAYALISSVIGAHNTMQTFVRSEHNALYDDLSRGVESDLTRALPPNIRVDCSQFSPAHHLLALLDPQLPPMTTAETLIFIEQISQLVAEAQQTGKADNC
jgi:hypothetical protein